MAIVARSEGPGKFNTRWIGYKWGIGQILKMAYIADFPYPSVEFTIYSLEVVFSEPKPSFLYERIVNIALIPNIQQNKKTGIRNNLV